MTHNERIMRDQIRSLLITLAAIRGCAAWEAVPADTREMADMAIEEAKETIGAADDCAAGACRWQG